MAHLHFRSAMVIVFAAAIGGGACGSTTFTSGGAGTGGSGGTNTGGTGGGPVDCSKSPIKFPDFERGCTGSDGSCAVAVHQIDCCGTMIVTGINRLVKNIYTKAETLCESQYPNCGCAAQPTRTDSDQIVTKMNAVKVACVNNVCTTYQLIKP